MQRLLSSTEKSCLRKPINPFLKTNGVYPTTLKVNHNCQLIKPRRWQALWCFQLQDHCQGVSSITKYKIKAHIEIIETLIQNLIKKTFFRWMIKSFA